VIANFKEEIQGIANGTKVLQSLMQKAQSLVVDASRPKT
jgi:hypothetical protein